MILLQTYDKQNRSGHLFFNCQNINGWSAYPQVDLIRFFNFVAGDFEKIVGVSKEPTHLIPICEKSDQGMFRVLRPVPEFEKNIK